MYFAILTFLFITIPVAELAVLMQAGKAWGILNTFALIIFTGVLGAAMARMEGLRVLTSMQTDMAAGRMPAPHIVDGVMILVAGVLLITPGFLTDMVGFTLLIPVTRKVLRKVALHYFKNRLQARGGSEASDTIEATYWEWDNHEERKNNE